MATVRSRTKGRIAWWKARALTTTLSVLPYYVSLFNSRILGRGGRGDQSGGLEGSLK